MALTPDEHAKIETEERELIERWINQLSPEEAAAWMDAHEDDLERVMEAVIQERADFVAIREALAPVIKEHPRMGLVDALEFIRKKNHRTLAEAEALDAFERVKTKPLRTKGGFPK
jgi:hypothetical protein